MSALKAASEELRPTIPCTFPGCTKIFTRQDYLKRHQLNHSEKPRLTCHICSRGFHRTDILKKHIARHQNIEDRQPTEKRRRYSRSHSPPSPATNGPSTSSSVQQPAVITSTSGAYPHPELDGGSSAGRQIQQYIPPTAATAHIGNAGPVAPYPVPYDVNEEPDAQTMDVFAWLFSPSPSDTHMRGTLDFSQHPGFGGNVAGSNLMTLAQAADTSSLLNLQSGGGAMPLVPAGAGMGAAGPDGYPAVPSDGTRWVQPESTGANTGAAPLSELVTEQRRLEILSLLEGLPLDLASPALSLESLQLYLEVYFVEFDPHYPIIHRPTLALRASSPAPSFPPPTSPTSASTTGMYPSASGGISPTIDREYERSMDTSILPHLLLAMACLGAVFARDGYGLAMARGVHGRLRGRVFEFVENNPRVSVPVLQTLLLINTFGRLFSTEVHHDMSQIFHSPSIVMTKFSGLFSAGGAGAGGFTVVPDSKSSGGPGAGGTGARGADGARGEEGWVEWAMREERKRTGWFAFIADTSNAAMFRHTLMVHCFAMKLDFPCPDALWAAASPAQWHAAQQAEAAAGRRELPNFLAALKSLATSGDIAPEMSTFSANILLHGLISVSWALLWRDLADMSMVHTSRITGWKDSLHNSFTIWQHFVAQRPRVTDAERAFYQAGVPFCLLGKVLLLTETEHLRILAGAPRVAGRLIPPEERVMAHRQVHAWARTSDGRAAVWSALELLRFVFESDVERHFLDPPGTTPWCCYVAVLTVWGFALVHEGSHDLSQTTPPFVYFTTTTSPSSQVEMELRVEPGLARKAALAYVARLLSCGAPAQLPVVPGKNDVAGPVAYVAELIGKVPWGIMSGPYRVLSRLLAPPSTL